VTGTCDAGYFCIVGATEAAPASSTIATKINGPCPIHHFCEAGSGYGIPCLGGTFDESEGNTEASDCSA
jgi:hypothetical protein